jgi:hypothetical protein
MNFSAGAGGARYLASGWSFPEVDGFWSDGPSSDLMFDIGNPPMTDLRFEFSFIVFQKPQGAPREVVIETMRGDPIDRWTLSAPAGPRSVIVPASGWMDPARTPMSVLFPAPFWPMIAVIVPARASRSIPCTAFVAPNDFWMFFATRPPPASVDVTPPATL